MQTCRLPKRFHEKVKNRKYMAQTSVPSTLMSTTPNELHHCHKKIHTRRPTLDKDRNKGRVGNISVVIYRAVLTAL